MLPFTQDYEKSPTKQGREKKGETAMRPEEKRTFNYMLSFTGHINICGLWAFEFICENLYLYPFKILVITEKD